MWINKLISGTLLTLFIISTSGCVPLMIGAAAGAGGIAYVRGNLERTVDYSVEQLHQASLQTLQDMGILVIDDDLTRHQANVKAEFEDGKDVKIDIDALTERVSKIKVRVGMLGDQELSGMIMDEIMANMPY